MNTKYKESEHGIESGVYLLDGVRPILIADGYVAVQEGKCPKLDKGLAQRLTRVEEDHPLLDNSGVCTWLTAQANHGTNGVKATVDMFYQTGEFAIPTDIVN